MGCRFNPKPTYPHPDLKVTWHWVTPTSVEDVIRLDNGVEHSAPPKYQGRVQLLTEELKEGWAKLKVSPTVAVMFSDSYNMCWTDYGLIPMNFPPTVIINLLSYLWKLLL